MEKVVALTEIDKRDVKAKAKKAAGLKLSKQKWKSLWMQSKTKTFKQLKV